MPSEFLSDKLAYLIKSFLKSNLQIEQLAKYAQYIWPTSTDLHFSVIGLYIDSFQTQSGEHN